MATEADFIVQKGKPWFSIGVLVSVAVLAASGAGVLVTVRAGQAEVTQRLATNEEAVKRGNDTLAQLAGDMRDMRLDVNAALLDRWSNTDTKFWGLEMDRFWSDFARLNPGVTLPTWPEPKRVSSGDNADGPRK